MKFIIIFKDCIQFNKFEFRYGRNDNQVRLFIPIKFKTDQNNNIVITGELKGEDIFEHEHSCLLFDFIRHYNINIDDLYNVYIKSKLEFLIKNVK